MCGRYSFTKSDEFGERFGVDYKLANLSNNYNVAPTQIMPVVTRLDGKNVIKLMRWGIPRRIGSNKVIDVFNTRSDKAFRTWKKLVTTQRILVPATSFYEWKNENGIKQPYLIRPNDQSLFSFAGIWSIWKDNNDNEIETYSIITTDANEQMRPIHNRMPVMLHQIEEQLWLSKDNNDNVDLLNEIMLSYDARKLELFAVSTDVNKTSNNNSQLNLPINSK